MKTAGKIRPRPSQPGELKLVLIGAGLVSAAAAWVLLGLGSAGGPVLGVVALYVFGFLGTGMLMAVWISRVLDRSSRAGEEDE